MFLLEYNSCVIDIMNIEKVKTTLWENRKMIFVLLILFIFAIGMRSNITRYEGNYLFEPDAYYHARLVQHLVVDGYIPEVDPDVYYFLEDGMTHQPPSLYHYIVTAMYSIVSLGFYSKELLAFMVQFASTIFGALIAIAMYFLARDTFDSKKVGLVAGFLTAVSPAFVYRTMSGAQGDNSLGFLWMVIGFLFFVRAIKTKTLKKEDIINVLLSGLFFALMVFTWRLNLLIPVVLLTSSAIILLKISGESTKTKNIFKSEFFTFIVKATIPMIIYTVASFLYGENWLLSAAGYAKNLVGSVELAMILGAIAVLAFIAVSYFIYNSKEDTRKLASTFAIAILYLGLLAMIIMVIVEPDFFYRDGGRQSIGSLVGEESVGYTSFGIKYNALVLLPYLGLLLFPISLWLFNKKNNKVQVIFWFWTIITLFMAWYKLKFTFVFGLGLVTGAALLAYILFEGLKKYELTKGIEGKTILIVFGALLILGVGANDLYNNAFQPFANSSPYWIETMDWIENNTSEDAKFFNWWGDGHQLAFVTERKFSADNRNASGEANKAYAEFNITTDVNRGYEIVKEEIGAEYIILPSSNFNAGGTYEFYVNDSVDSRLAAKYNDFGTRNIGCSETVAGVNCGGQTIPQEQYDSFNTNWTSQPTDFFNGSVAIYYYTTNDQLFILGPTYNQTNLAKVYFNSSETSNFYEEVYSYNGMKIFRVK
jgi:asparagine N-glycosylation enzyme membrane subunit Stt3